MSWYRLHAKTLNRCLIANNGKITHEIDPKCDKLITEMEQMTIDMTKIKNIYKPTSIPLTMPVNFYKYENNVSVKKLDNILKDNLDQSLINGLMCNSNETEDSFLTDLAVASNKASYLRVGGFNRIERVSKINRLIEIECYLRENDLLIDNSSKSIEFPSNFEVSEDIKQQIKELEESTSVKKPTKNK